jgi:hypothetical protein
VSSCSTFTAASASTAQAVCADSFGRPCCNCRQVQNPDGGMNPCGTGTCGNGSGTTDAGVGAGAPGTTCTSNTDCKTGRCLGTDAPGRFKYCSPECSQGADCADFYYNGGGVNIPLSVNLQGTNNAWNSSSLFRSAECTTLAGLPNVGTDDGKKYCWFVCPANSAQVFNSSGATTKCSCLPNFKTPSGSPNPVYDCQWDSAVQCSIFKACPTNTSTDACAKDVSCLVGLGLTGKCWSQTSNIEACVQSKTASCDGACLANSCLGTTLSAAGNDPCVDMCCK